MFGPWMTRWRALLFIGVAGGFAACEAVPAPQAPTGRAVISPATAAGTAAAGTSAAPTVGAGAGIAPPPAGKIYHGVFPGGTHGEEDTITPADLSAYEAAAGKSAAWIYFSNEWGKSRLFPVATASWIRDHGSVPFIRLMLRTSTQEDQAEPTFTLDRIRAGDFDADLQAWGKAAHDFGTPLLAEYGTEVNGRWFPWNGAWNGAGQQTLAGEVSDGPQRFREAYRHLIRVTRAAGALNVHWAFHANAPDAPAEAWNRLEQYYPGSDWIDWIGVSIYGAVKPDDTEAPAFRDLMDAVYPRLAALDPNKPIVVLEFGVTDHNPLVAQADWASRALSDLDAQRWPRVIGYSWWNEAWQNDDNPADDSVMRLQSNPALAAAFRQGVSASANVLGQFVGLSGVAASNAAPAAP